MKKLLFIIALGLTLTGCFHDPKETALENCANSSVMDKYYSINNDLYENSFLRQNRRSMVLRLSLYLNPFLPLLKSNCNINFF